MEKYVDQIVEFIRKSNDFQFLDINLTNNNMGATIIDGILQAGLNFNNVVKPRVDKYKNEYRHVITTSDFSVLINNCDLSEMINMKGQKIERIFALVKFLKNEKIETEDDFYTWLLNDENVLALSNIKGIKTKTIEYLKILTGHKNTLAIDVRLRNFIKLCCDLEITNDKFAYEILMKAAQKLMVEPATLDFSIWSYMTPEKLKNKK